MSHGESEAAAPNKVRDLSRKEWVVPTLPERYLLDLKTDCNLKCPMCLMHGDPAEKAKHPSAIGTMTIENARKLLDEIQAAKPVVAPSWWGEPFLVNNLKDRLREMKERGMTIAINTNGLVLSEEMATFLVDLEVDSVFFSVDAMTPETLKVVRGVTKVDKIRRNCEMLIRIRNAAGKKLPRIGASYTIQKENEHELDEFVDVWTKIVDVVRVGYVFEAGSLRGIDLPEKRVPCAMLYHTMPIHYNGDASICCFDSYGSEIVGNVFEDGVAGVWNGEKLNQIRHYHESEQWDKVPFCKDCNAWAGQIWQEEIKDGLLIRKSVQMTYYNRLDRMDSWHENIRGGHAQPDREEIQRVLTGKEAAE